MLLAASLRKQLGFRYELIAAIPHPERTWGRVSDVTSSIMKALSIRPAPIENPIDECYPIGNKLACLAVETSAKMRVFLDSDILCLRPIADDSFPAEFNAKPADICTWPLDPRGWELAYAAMGLPLPKRRVRATVSGELMLPYFNAGVIAIREGTDFVRQWTQFCRRIDRDDSIRDKRPHLDQIGLSLALSATSLEFSCLGEELNYPAHLKLLTEPPPALCHYHHPDILRKDPRLNSEVIDLIYQWPQLGDLLALCGYAWAHLRAPFTNKSSASKHRVGRYAGWC